MTVGSSCILVADLLSKDNLVPCSEKMSLPLIIDIFHRYSFFSASILTLIYIHYFHQMFEQ